MKLKNSEIFIDLDGTLLDSRPRYYKVAQVALETTKLWCKTNNLAFEANLISSEEFWTLKTNGVHDSKIAMRLGLTKPQAQTYLTYVNQLANHPLLESYNVPIIHVNQALENLKQSGAKLSLLTLRPQSNAEQTLKNHGWDTVFDAVHGIPNGAEQYDTKVRVKTRLLEKAILSGVSVEPSNSWIIGDTDADIIAGKTFGLNTAALTCGMRSYTQLAPLTPTIISPNLLEAFYRIHHLASFSQYKNTFSRSRSDLLIQPRSQNIPLQKIDGLHHISLSV